MTATTISTTAIVTTTVAINIVDRIHHLHPAIHQIRANITATVIVSAAVIASAATIKATAIAITSADGPCQFPFPPHLHLAQYYHHLHRPSNITTATIATTSIDAISSAFALTLPGYVTWQQVLEQPATFHHLNSAAFALWHCYFPGLFAFIAAAIATSIGPVATAAVT
jgi:hypothetical protein